jgi:integrase
MRLDAKTVACLDLGGKSDAIYFDDQLVGFGFRLRQGAGGKLLRSWVVQYRHHSATRRMTVGNADILSAEQARAAAKKVLAQVELGADPQGERSERRDRDALTFRSQVQEYLQTKRDEVRPATRRVVTLYLTGPYFKPLHGVPVDQINRRDVAAQLGIIGRKHGKITEAAARSALHAFFLWCVQMGLSEHNPVVGTRRPNPPPARSRVLTDPELARIWQASAEVGDFGKIVRLLILIPCRRGEIGGLRASEFAPDLSTWTLPEARAKNGHEHTLPLLETARSIIESIPKRAGRDQLFGEYSADGFNDWHAAKRLLDEKSDVTGWRIHDIRRTVATKMADIGIQPHIIEQILNHQSGHKAGPAGIYNRSSYEREVRAALAQWEDHIRILTEGGERKVINFPPVS